MRGNNNRKVLLPKLNVKTNCINNAKGDYCTFCKTHGHIVSTCKKTSLCANDNKILCKTKPPLHSKHIVRNNTNNASNDCKSDIIKQQLKITSLKKLRKRLTTDKTSITSVPKV